MKSSGKSRRGPAVPVRFARQAGGAPRSPAQMRTLDRTCMRPFRKQAFLRKNQFR